MGGVPGGSRSGVGRGFEDGEEGPHEPVDRYRRTGPRGVGRVVGVEVEVGRLGGELGGEVGGEVGVEVGCGCKNVEEARVWGRSNSGKDTILSFRRRNRVPRVRSRVRPRVRWGGWGGDLALRHIIVHSELPLPHKRVNILVENIVRYWYGYQYRYLGGGHGTFRY